MRRKKWIQKAREAKRSGKPLPFLPTLDELERETPALRKQTMTLTIRWGVNREESSTVTLAFRKWYELLQGKRVTLWLNQTLADGERVEICWDFQNDWVMIGSEDFGIPGDIGGGTLPFTNLEPRYSEKIPGFEELLLLLADAPFEEPAGLREKFGKGG